MNKEEYRYEPAAYAIYRVEENCCYTKVVIDGPCKGIYKKLDRLNEEIGDLLCYICDASREIIPVTAEFFQRWHNKIMNQGS